MSGEDAKNAFTAHLARKKKAEQGKDAEKAVKTWGEKKIAALGLDFDFWRIPDARAAGGRFPAQAGDFACCYKKTRKHALIEVKKTEVQQLKLPKANFPVDQIGRVYKRFMAGAVTVVLVYHMKTDTWYPINIKHFYGVEGPWDLALHSKFSSAATALDCALFSLFN